MDQVCAIIDAQGYTINGQFHPREVAVVSHKMLMCVLCDNENKFKDLSVKEMKSAQIVYSKTGLPFESSTDKWRKFEKNTSSERKYDGMDVILMMYQWVHTEDKPLVGIKNPQMRPILEMWDIPYLDMPEKEEPMYEQLYRKHLSRQCEYHCKENSRCALTKALGLWEIVTLKNADAKYCEHCKVFYNY